MMPASIEHLWEQFALSRSFISWDAERDLTQEWEELYRTRKEILNAPELVRSQSIIDGHHYRHLQNVAFEYNALAPDYNGSFIEIYGNRFIALEAPKPENVDLFLSLLKQHQTAQLVRLASTSRIGEPFYAYWKERVIPFDYFAIDHWDDNQPVEAKELITLVKTVRAAQAIRSGTVAVHCSSSIGRTGTFIAAWALMDRIDRGETENLSVQELVYRLCMQRPAMVCSEAQYRVLHEVVSLYMKERPKSESLRKAANHYVAVLNKIGEPRSDCRAEEIKLLCTENCKKVRNGKLLFEGSERFAAQLEAGKEWLGSWSMDVQEVILSTENRTATIRYKLATEKEGDLVVIAILRFDSKGLINEINEVHNKREK